MKTVERELRLRRYTFDEALWRLNRYLYDAFVAGLPSVCIVHSKGTGQLRRAVHDHEPTPLVKSYRLGDYDEGDYGVTIAELTNH